MITKTITKSLSRAVSLAAGVLLSMSLAAGLAQAAPEADAITAAGTAEFGSVDREAPRTWDSATGEQLRDWECSEYHVCFWTGRNGTGSRCLWEIADADWAGGGTVCSWALTRNVASVLNLGTSSDGSTGVAYYKETNYRTRAGCTRNQHGGNLAGTYKLRSHKWISSSCG